jgi:rubredoxin
MRYKCSCCGYYTLPEESAGNYNICPVCNWEDDYVQLHNPDFEGGANRVSLNQAKANFELFGATETRFIDEVRKPLPEELPENNQ